MRSWLRHRVTGLAGEAAFFAILSLPPLIFGLAGTIGFAADAIRPAALTQFRAQVLHLASHLLTSNAVDTVLKPTLNEVLSRGRADVVSIGFAISLWSGSRSLNVFLDTITIMYGLGGRRNFIRGRLLALVLYVACLLIAAVLTPLMLAGPGLLDRITPEIPGLGYLYWSIVGGGSVFFLAAAYTVAVPLRHHLRLFRFGLPGAIVALMIWTGGSIGLRHVLSRSTHSTSVYGPLAAPIAILLWLYLLSIAAPAQRQRPVPS